MFNKYFYSFVLGFFLSIPVLAQYNVPLYTAYTTQKARAGLKERLINHSITRNLQTPLSDSTEEYWQDAFDAMEVMNYQTPFTEQQIHKAFIGIEKRSATFQRALLEVVYSLYPGKFTVQAHQLLNETSETKVFAMCAEYLLQKSSDPQLKKKLLALCLDQFGDSVYTSPILSVLAGRLEAPQPKKGPSVPEILKKMVRKDFLPGQIVMYSFQRKSRDFPGMVVIRNADGNFIKDSTGTVFHVPQLARSITNLPGYLTNGNTPQGIFRMYGFGVSMSSFIGPTPNVQMGMPVELTLKQFFDDSTIEDSIWTMDWYQRLIPPSLRDYLPLYDAYFAGLAGRSEIIAHGTTIDPGFYHGKPYFPLTPTQGCLCTKEIWNGIREESDQQLLVNALLKAGGAKGYCVVIELDNRPAPVSLTDIFAILP